MTATPADTAYVQQALLYFSREYGLKAEDGSPAINMGTCATIATKLDAAMDGCADMMISRAELVIGIGMLAGKLLHEFDADLDRKPARLSDDGELADYAKLIASTLVSSYRGEVLMRADHDASTLIKKATANG